MKLFKKLSIGWCAKGRDRLFATLPLIYVVLLAAWMGWAGQAGYFARDWGPTAFVLAALFLIASATGWLRGGRSRWSALAIAVLASYAGWTVASLLDSYPGRRRLARRGADASVPARLLGRGWPDGVWILTALGAPRVGLGTADCGAAHAGGPHLAHRLPLRESPVVRTAQYCDGEVAFLLVPF